ncbi:MAG: DinB family protein [Ignavibacteria bacterium]|nr:DinB family protein [Ignavibacteria bacterium]
MNILSSQYLLIKSSREVVLKYFSEIKPSDFARKLESFNNSSMQSLYIHSLNTYIHWLKRFAKKEEYPYFKTEELKSANDFCTAFETINSIVEEFISEHSDPFDKITGYITWQKKDFTYTALDLFTHVTTHEFHHKGQLMIMSRLLGYSPPDADAIRY